MGNIASLSLLGYVAAGGAAGAVARYMAAHWVSALAGKHFPYGTLLVNVSGSFLMGALVAFVTLALPKGRELYLLLGVGFLGGFTTFSTFSYDAYVLIEKGDWLAAALYMGGSVVAGIAAFMMGMWLCKTALS